MAPTDADFRRFSCFRDFSKNDLKFQGIRVVQNPNNPQPAKILTPAGKSLLWKVSMGSFLFDVRSPLGEKGKSAQTHRKSRSPRNTGENTTFYKLKFCRKKSHILFDIPQYHIWRCLAIKQQFWQRVDLEAKVIAGY